MNCQEIKREAITVERKMKPDIEKPYGYIYITTNLVNNKKYVGQHFGEEFDPNYYGSGVVLLKSIEKYGKENFICESIEWIKSKEELDQKEIWWIDFLDAVESDDWYNLSVGGTGGNTWIGLSNEQKDNLHRIQSKRMRKNNPMKHQETREKLRKSITGRVVSLETKEKMRNSQLGSKNHNFGVPMSSERKLQLSNSHTGSGNPRARRVAQLDSNNVVIHEFDCIKDVKKFGFDPQSVMDCCKGRQIKHHKFMWKYID